MDMGKEGLKLFRCRDKDKLHKDMRENHSHRSTSKTEDIAKQARGKVYVKLQNWVCLWFAAFNPVTLCLAAVH